MQNVQKSTSCCLAVCVYRFATTEVVENNRIQLQFILKSIIKMWFWDNHSIQIDCKTSKVIPLQNLQTAASVLDDSKTLYHIEFKTNQLFSLDWSWQDSLEIQGKRIKFFSSANRLGKTRTKSALPVSCSVWNKIPLIIHLIQLHSSLLLFVALYRAQNMPSSTPQRKS